MILFPDLPDLLVEHVEMADEITIMLRTTSPTALCPTCGTGSTRVQSRYRRTLHDLPSAGCPVHLIVHLRRFFCKKHTCAQKIFVERLPDLCQPHAQRTTRWQEALCQLGLRVGGQAGADVGSELGISGSRDTILRLVRRSQQSIPSEPRIIGLDDWARRRRLRYGTLICDLERSQPIALLPDRSVETVSAWLKKHPSIDIVSRDGSSEYASAISKGAPQARQVSDRWHVGKNLSACVSTLLAHTLRELRMARMPQKAREGVRHNGETAAVRQAQRQRQAERTQRYEQILALRAQGMEAAAIADQMNMPARTIRHWVARGSAPDFRHRWSRIPAHLSGPLRTPLLQRWQQGCRNVSQLDRELRSLGYKGSRRTLYRFVATFESSSVASGEDRPEASGRQKESAVPSRAALTLSVPQATWLFFRTESDLNEKEQQNLADLRQAHPSIEKAYHLVSAFLQMLRERTGHHLEQWLIEAQESGLSEFEPFITGVQKDKDAVLAGLTLPWSNGPLEGHVNRLKLIKRSMYGRAEFDLLTSRVLHQGQKNQERKDKAKKQHMGRLRKPKRTKHSANSQHTTIDISRVA